MKSARVLQRQGRTQAEVDDRLGWQRDVAVRCSCADRACTGTDEATDQRSFAATGDPPDQRSSARASTDHRGGSFTFTR